MKSTVSGPTTDELLIMLGISPAACDAALHQFFARRNGRAMRDARSLQMSNPMQRLRSQTTAQALYGRAVDTMVGMQEEIDREIESSQILPDLALTADSLGGVFFDESIEVF